MRKESNFLNKILNKQSNPSFLRVFLFKPCTSRLKDELLNCVHKESKKERNSKYKSIKPLRSHPTQIEDTNSGIGTNH